MSVFKQIPMKPLPPDWDKDRELWEMMGKLPSHRPSSNFAYRIYQKLAQEAYSSKHKILLPFPTFSLFRSWAGGAIAACLILLGVWLYQLQKPGSASQTTLPIARNIIPQENSKENSVEIDLLAQNIELLQDLDVIEHLDELQ